MTDNVPQFRVQLTHPSSSEYDQQGNPIRVAVLRVEETVSSLTVFELELTSGDLHDLMSSRFAYPSIRRLGKHPERWGHEMRVHRATCGTQEGAELIKANLEDGGWTVDKIHRDNTYRYVIVGRRWDEEKTDEMDGGTDGGGTQDA
jgi:hypothetical protein